jgi:hypothetical protein
MAYTEGEELAAAYLLIKTRLRPARDEFDVSDVREEVANAVTNPNEELGPVYYYRQPGGEMLPPQSAIVLTGPTHVIVPLVAEDRTSLDEIIGEITDGNEWIIPEQTRALYVARYFLNGQEIPGVPEFSEMGKEVALRDRSIAYVFVKTEEGRAEEVASRASELDAGGKLGPRIANYEKGGEEPLNSIVDSEPMGVRWAAVIEDTDSAGEAVDFQLLLHLNTLDNDHLGRALAAIRRIPGVTNPTGITATSVHEGGNETKAVKNGPPR